MSKLGSCTSCDGFLPAAATRCPHCDTAVPRSRPLARRLLAAAGAGAMSITLMACYGMAPVQQVEPPRQPACEEGAQPNPDGTCPEPTQDDGVDDTEQPAPEVRAAPDGDGEATPAPE